jgi:trk system potassium uptake protein TrkH
MNWKMIFRIISYILMIEIALMCPAFLISLAEHETAAVTGYLESFVIMAIVTAVLFILTRHARKGFNARDGFVTTGLTWIIMSALGCLPFYLSHEIPSYVDCLFEMISGFTTTGSSILTNVEALDKGLLWWRSFSHWVGGMGILVFMLAIVPLGGKNQGFTMHILRAESPGPSVGKVVPRMRKTASILYGIYIGLTIADILFLRAGGMTWFEACCHAFGTAGTGGFGVKNDSYMSYSPYLQYVTTVFMLLFSVNFSIYYMILIKRFKEAFFDQEFKTFWFIVGTCIILLTLNVRNLYPTLEEAFRHSAFTTATILSTTGYATTDFNQWSAFAKALILIMMCLGACAGSTGGGIKTIRTVLLFKTLRRNLHKNLHPEEVDVVKVNGRRVDEQIIRNTEAYLIAYVIIVLSAFLLVSLDGFDVETNLSAVLATFNNIGPGLGAVGPTGNFAAYSNLSKIVFVFCMLAGRLEIYPIMIFFSRKTWKKGR